MIRMSYYDILEVSPTASAETIHAAYRALSKKYHPDVCPDGTEQMQRINEAYGVLSDPVRRGAYDAERQRASRPNPPGQAQPPRQGPQPQYAGQEGVSYNGTARSPGTPRPHRTVRRPMTFFGAVGWLLLQPLRLVYVLLRIALKSLKYFLVLFAVLLVIGLFTGHTQLLFRVVADLVQRLALTISHGLSR